MTNRWYANRWSVNAKLGGFICLKHEAGHHFDLDPQLVQQIWKHVDSGQQAFEADVWFVENDEDFGGLSFSRRSTEHGGGHFWGMSDTALEALLSWRNRNGLSTSPTVSEEEFLSGPDDLDAEGLTVAQRGYFETLNLLDPEGKLDNVTAAAKKQLKEQNFAAFKNKQPEVRP